MDSRDHLTFPAAQRRMPHRLVIALAILAAAAALAAALPRPVAAHPLGNFTVNRYARLEPTAESVRVIYALDMAEIPTFQELREIDRDRDGAVSDAERDGYLRRKLPELAQNLHLTVAGTRLPFRSESSALSFAEGQGGLQILRIDAAFVAQLPANRPDGLLDAQFRDANYDERAGWKEIVVRGTDGAAVSESSVATEDISDALRSYPTDLLQNAPDQREARFRFEPGVAGGGDTPTTARQVAERTTRAVSPGILSRFAESAATEDLTVPVMTFSLLAAVFWGALHALGPGHGKTVVAAFLVGSRGTAKHAAFLGLTVTATHTASTYLLGFVTLFASAFIVPERLYPILSLASGLMVVAMGLSLLVGRMRAAGVRPFRRPLEPVEAASPAASTPVAAPLHSHGFGIKHSHGPMGVRGLAHGRPGQGAASRPVTLRSLLALGIYGGMIPCPTAIVVLLISISLNRVGFGLLLVVAFSLGLAGVLMGIGFALVYAGRAVARIPRFRGSGVLAAAVPVMSAALVVAAGILITLRATGQAWAPPV